MEIIRIADTEFNFIGIRAAAVRAKSIGIVNLNEQQLLWWIVSGEYSETWTPHGVIELEAQMMEESRELFDAAAISDGGRFLAHLIYGRVPRGFRQMKPEVGRPSPMRRGFRYVLHFLGSEMGALEFDF